MLHITAKQMDSNKPVDMFFMSISDAKFHNPKFKDFRIKGYIKK